MTKVTPTPLHYFFCLFIATAQLYAADTLELTPIGAEAAANADQSIPAWTGGLQNTPEGYDPDSPDHLPNPYADDKPLYRIDHASIEANKDLLSVSQLHRLQANKDYYLDVYPSRRSAGYPKEIYEASRINTSQTRLSNDGNGLDNYHKGVPFITPTSGIEVIWNHITRYRGTHIRRVAGGTLVQDNGSFSIIKNASQISFSHALEEGDENMLYYFKSQIIAPIRKAGDVLLVHETLDQIKTPRMAWLYSAAQRRVRRIPGFEFDSEIPLSDGFVVADQADMFNGSPAKYNWILHGKRELIIPYNNYALFDRTLGYEDILKRGQINPALVRYEKHRVWVVEARLKQGERHVYARRMFYIDEDTWQIAIVDYYDDRGNLWRMGEAYALYFYHHKIPYLAFEATFDLHSQRYIVMGISNEEKRALQYDIPARLSDYTPAAIRREGRR